MEYKLEKRICQNCKKDFTVEEDDFSFYEKIKVPPPTFCPECRMIRRMTWRNERSLFKRKCDFTGEDIITMFHPDADVKVYGKDIWWGDKLDPKDYGQSYYFSKPFFEQYKDLLSKVPFARQIKRRRFTVSFFNVSPTVYLYSRLRFLVHRNTSNKKSYDARYTGRLL